MNTSYTESSSLAYRRAILTIAVIFICLVAVLLGAAVTFGCLLLSAPLALCFVLPALALAPFLLPQLYWFELCDATVAAAAVVVNGVVSLFACKKTAVA